MTVYYLMVVLGVLLAAMSQMLLKKSSLSTHASVINEYLNCWVILGYTLLALSLVLDIWAMSYGVLAKEVSSLESLSYFFVPLLSAVFFKERITKTRIVAIVLIMIGVIVFFL